MNKFVLWLALTLLAIPVGAQSVDGNWIFDRASDYEGLNQTAIQSPISALQVANSQAILSANCIVKLNQNGYYPGGPFQALLKSGEDESAISKFLFKQFNFRLIDTKVYYSAESGASCNKLGSSFLVSDEKLLAIRGGVLFYAFKRVKLTPGALDASAVPIDLGDLKTSSLPFDLAAYNNTCLGTMPKRKGVPQINKRCGSAFVPYIVGRDSKPTLLRLIGAHAFVKNGARGASEDYDDPVSHGLNPVVAILPPFKGVVVVRVDDLEGGGDTRDTMSGAYLALKGGKVTDQLNEGCSFDADFICSTPGESTKYKLLESGKFAPQK